MPTEYFYSFITCVTTLHASMMMMMVMVKSRQVLTLTRARYNSLWIRMISINPAIPNSVGDLPTLRIRMLAPWPWMGKLADVQQQNYYWKSASRCLKGFDFPTGIGYHLQWLSAQPAEGIDIDFEGAIIACNTSITKESIPGSRSLIESYVFPNLAI